MAAGDEERREVAVELRGKAKELCRLSRDELGEAIGLSEDDFDTTWGFDQAAYARLADLVDRPTCRNVGRGRHAFKCSACGCWTDGRSRIGLPDVVAAVLKTQLCRYAGVDPADARMTAPHASVPRYCPMCGAEVTGVQDRGLVDVI